MTAFRRDINGLRAIAVLAVLCFHFGISPLHGGFVGVDVFFVISGFLMTQILTLQIERGKIDVLKFYMARVLRILPALVGATLTTLLLASMLLLPYQFITAAQEAFYAVTFIINIYFWKNTGYFAPQAAHSWFLHCWSLAVEIQFYVIVPFYLMLTAYLSPKRGTMIGLLALVSVSLAFSFFQTGVDPNGAFYLPFSRLWEFGAGGLITRFSVPKRGQSVMAVVGLLAIATSCLFFSDTMKFPGLWPVLPVAGTALVIWSESRNVLLTNVVSQALGTASYSIYLWHWPLLLAAKYFGLQESPIGTSILFIMTFVAAAASYRWVELPFRTAGKGRWIAPILGSAFAIILVAGFSWAVTAYQGWPWRISPIVRGTILEAQYSNDWRSQTCFLDPEQSFDDFKSECLAPPGDKPRLVLWGDSGAAMFYPGIVAQSWSSQFRIEQLTASACPALPGEYDPIARPHCKQIQERILQIILQQKPEIVLLSSAIGPFGSATVENVKSHAEEYGAKLAALAKSLESSGVKRVVVWGTVPTWDNALPEVFYRQFVTSGHKIPDNIRPFKFERIQQWETVIREAVKNAGATYISLIEALCDDASCRPTILDSKMHPAIIQFDTFHLTRPASIWAADSLLSPAIEDSKL